jgi:MOSC domain-containing protein YiiM
MVLASGELRQGKLLRPVKKLNCWKGSQRMSDFKAIGRIYQINLSEGGVPKLPVERAEVTEGGLVGDGWIHTKVHGGPDRAVCLYSWENLQALQAEGHPVFPGAMGENLTLEGVDWLSLVPGTRLKLGESVEIEITRYTVPCNSLVPYFVDGHFGRVSQDKHPGWARVYARVIHPGFLKAGDSLSILQVL